MGSACIAQCLVAAAFGVPPVVGTSSTSGMRLPWTRSTQLAGVTNSSARRKRQESVDMRCSAPWAER